MPSLAIPSKNPTIIVTDNTGRVAVGLLYNQSMDAPVVTIKGIDEIALQIKQIGANAAVPIMENSSLAHEIYDSCNIETEIPEKFYIAVANMMRPLFSNE